MTSRAIRMASAGSGVAANTPGSLTPSFLKSFARSPDEPLRAASISSQYHILSPSSERIPREIYSDTPIVRIDGARPLNTEARASVRFHRLPRTSPSLLRLIVRERRSIICCRHTCDGIERVGQRKAPWQSTLFAHLDLEVRI